MRKTTRTDSYSHILKYTGLFGGVQGVGILVGIVRNKLIAVILGPQGMGLVSLFNSTIKFVSDSTNFGISMSGVRHISEAFEQSDSGKIERAVALIRYWSLLAAALGTVLCVVLSPLFNHYTFSWSGHLLHFILLSPIVGMMAITGGELAILKGARRLRHLAAVTVYNLLAALVISVPIYYFFGDAGIVPSLFLMALVQMLLVIVCSYRIFPFNLKSHKTLFREGLGMVRLGTAFVIAGVLGSGADFLIRTYLNSVSCTETVGLYNAGFMMTMTYVGMVFSAMETDYFPRLSGVAQLGTTFNTMVNRQIEVMLLLVSPLLVAFMVGLPVLLPLLYSGKFNPAMGMMRFVILVMYFRALKLPVEYIPLARGDSKSYLLMEMVYDILLVAAVVFCYDRYGLDGTGVGILVAGFLTWLCNYGYAGWKYGYHPSRSVLSYALGHVAIGVLSFLCTGVESRVAYWLLGGILFMASLSLSVSALKRRTQLSESIRQRIIKLFRGNR